MAPGLNQHQNFYIYVNVYFFKKIVNDFVQATKPNFIFDAHRHNLQFFSSSPMYNEAINFYNILLFFQEAVIFYFIHTISV